MVLHPNSSKQAMTEQALGQYYFLDPQCPVNLSKVARRKLLTHDHDLTEIEHYHDFIELVFIMHGQGVQVLEGNEYPVSAGDVFVLQGYQRHYFKDANSVEIVNVMFDGNKNPELIGEKVRQLEGYKALFILEPQLRSNRKYGNMLHLTREELAPLEVIINTMFAEQQHKRAAYEIIMVNRLQELVVLLSRQVSSNTSTKARALVRIGKVVDYLEENYAEDIYNELLAEMAYMSKRNFMRIFQEAVGMPANSYLRQVRMQKACALLSEGNAQIEEVAQLCGFNDHNFFIKCFKKSYGVTPSKFRARYRV
jgi:AraC-like DNA-binding protein